MKLIAISVVDPSTLASIGMAVNRKSAEPKKIIRETGRVTLLQHVAEFLALFLVRALGCGGGESRAHSRQ